MSHSVVVREKTENGFEQWDVFSRLAKDRILMLDTDFNDYMASLVVAQLLFLANEGDQDITIYINSPGGSVSSGLAIYDTMQYIPNRIKTIVIGNACSMGAFILSAGTKGLRFSTPSARIMIHRVSGGHEGAFPDMEISFNETKRINDYLHDRMAIHCGKTSLQMKKAMDRDNWLSPEEAKKFGIIDDILPVGKYAWK
jgi:ATP-dependent Clp protease protease subunit